MKPCTTRFRRDELGSPDFPSLGVGTARVGASFETVRNLAGEFFSMPRIFWTPTRDQLLRDQYPRLGPAATALLLGTSRRSAVNRAYRLSLKTSYPRQRARPGFPPRGWSRAERLLAQALLDVLVTAASP